jgi:Mce-associated membrane protein
VTPNWYDLLDVDRDATPGEIRTAWKAAIADLEPDDRRFRVYNEAGAVLLDPERRAAYDATLTADEAPDEAPVEADAEPAAEEPEPEGAIAATDETPAAADPGERSRRANVLVWLTAVLAVVAVAVVATTVYAWTRPDPVDEDAARAAARAAVVPVLSFDYRTLDEDAAAARTYLTSSFREEYDKTFTLLESNAPRTKTVVATEDPLADAVVRSSRDRVEVLLYVNQPTTNAQGTTTYRNQVTLKMKLVDGTWLVDGLTTNLTQK